MTKQKKNQVSDKALAEFARVNSWRHQMDNSRGLDGWDNYSGDDLGEKIVVLSTSRDADIMTESNFDSALEMLGGESKHVEVEQVGHWACGWIKMILVNPKSKKHLKIAYEIRKALEDYPVLDDSDFNDREYEYQSNYANEAKDDLAEALTLHFGIAGGPMLTKLAFELNMTCQRNCGNDACLNIYKMRAPDAYDVERLADCLRWMEWEFAKSTKYQALVRRVQAYQAKAVA